MIFTRNSKDMIKSMHKCINNVKSEPLTMLRELIGVNRPVILIDLRSRFKRFAKILELRHKDNGLIEILLGQPLCVYRSV